MDKLLPDVRAHYQVKKYGAAVDHSGFFNKAKRWIATDANGSKGPPLVIAVAMGPIQLHPCPEKIADYSLRYLLQRRRGQLSDDDVGVVHYMPEQSGDPVTAVEQQVESRMKRAIMCHLNRTTRPSIVRANVKEPKEEPDNVEDLD